MKLLTLLTNTLILVAIQSSLFAQSTVVVRPGQNNVPITEMKFLYNGSAVTQTTEASGTNVNTNLALSLTHLKVNDAGSVKTLTEFNFQGAVIRNNNFTSSTAGVGVYNLGTSTSAVNTSAWEQAMITSGTDNNLLNYLYYDGATNVPSGDDFDIIWTKGWNDFEYLVVGERNGNTCFALTPIDSTGNTIGSATIIQFGNCNGTNLQEYDWNTGYAPGNYNNQPFVFTVVKMSEFNTSSTIYGFRIDNTGNADPKFFGISDQPFSDNLTNPMIAGIGGNIFHDIDGLSDSLVDGTGINNASRTKLYANLVDNSGNVVATTPIAADGSYEFLNLDAGTYSVVLSTQQGSIGQKAPAAILPADWTFTGEHIGTDVGSDGNPNGIISNITLSTSFVFDVNMGIEIRPEADDKIETISSPVFHSTTALTSANGYPLLSGSDTEDGTLGQGATLVITDTNGLNGNQLFYDGFIVNINSRIENFDQSLLTVKYAGDLSTSFRFSYYFEDAAGQAPVDAATYDINWGQALPVEWLSFHVEASKYNKVDLHWSTAQEFNNSHFVVLRSDDFSTFYEIGRISGKGTYWGLSEYSFEDYTVRPGQTYAYKVAQIDFDGKSSETQTASISLKLAIDHKIKAFPNPFKNTIELSSGNTAFDRLVVSDMTGKILVDLTDVSSGTSTQLNTIDWPRGLYFVTSYTGSSALTSRLIKN